MCAYDWFLQGNLSLTLNRRTTNFKSGSCVIFLLFPPRLIQILTVVSSKYWVWVEGGQYMAKTGPPGGVSWLPLSIVAKKRRLPFEAALLVYLHLVSLALSSVWYVEYITITVYWKTRSIWFRYVIKPYRTLGSHKRYPWGDTGIEMWGKKVWRFYGGVSFRVSSLQANTAFHLDFGMEHSE